MARILPLLTLIPTIFALIAIILINIGGVSSPSFYRYTSVANTEFPLISWSYKVTPSPDAFYPVSIYLNRWCRGPSTQYGEYTAMSQCVDDNTYGEFGKRSGALTPTLVLAFWRPFQFDTVDLTVPFALYVTSAGLVFLTMVCAICTAGFGAKKRGLVARGLGALGSVTSLLSFIFVLAASALVTQQMLHLGEQVRNNTQTTDGGNNREGQVHTLDILSVTLGRTVQGLTWAAVVAMLIATAMWIWVFATVKVQSDSPPPYTQKETVEAPLYTQKEERLDSYLSDYYVQGRT